MWNFSENSFVLAKRGFPLESLTVKKCFYLGSTPCTCGTSLVNINQFTGSTCLFLFQIKATGCSEYFPASWSHPELNQFHFSLSLQIGRGLMRPLKLQLFLFLFFLATLVALHSTPVTDLVTGSFGRAEFRTSVASRLASLLKSSCPWSKLSPS